MSYLLHKYSVNIELPSSAYDRDLISENGLLLPSRGDQLHSQELSSDFTLKGTLIILIVPALPSFTHYNVILNLFDLLFSVEH